MKYKTKIKINGAELTDEQSSSASSITAVSLEASAGNGFQVGNSSASALSVTILKPYKTSFDGDKVEFYILPDGEDDESLAEKLEEEVGSTEETEHVEDNDETDDIETEEVDDGEGEEMTAEEEAEAEAEDDAEESNLFDVMNGEEVTGEVTEEEAVPDPADWELFGVFYVYKQTNNRDGSITLRCYDGFQLLHGDYVPAIKSGTIQQFYDDIRTQCAELGVTVDPEEFAEEENVTITWNQVCSFRQAIGYIAGLVGGYATFGDDDTLGIDYYAYNDRVLLLPELLDYKTTSAGETQIDGVVCTVNLRGDTVESGDGGQSITFYNPFATQQTVDSILEQYQGIRYIGANVKAKWDPSVRCGDLVRVMSEAEYRNYIAMGNAFRNSGEMTAAEVLNLKKELNAVGRTILVSSQRIDFGGETTVEIRSHLMTETEKANAPLSPSDAKFRVVTADLIRTKELIAQKAEIEDLKATNALIKNLKAEDVKITGRLDAAEGNIGNLQAEDVKITGRLDAAEGSIGNLQAEDVKITGRLDAAEGNIKVLDTKKLSAEDADLRYVNIDFSKIDKAWLQKFYAQSGIIKDLVIGDSTVTGHLVGVTISGDLLEGNTVKADKLVVKGEDGLYYKLNIEGGSTVTPELTKEVLQNGLDGNNIIANTITAEKIQVDDLIAFDATIGGFNIASNAIYSGVKSSVDNTTRGMYLGADGQMSFGDSNNYIKYHKDEKTGKYALEIMADHMIFGSTGTNVQDAIEEAWNKANKAQSTANEAKDSAIEAAKTASNYISSSTYGLMVSMNTGEVKETPATATSRNILITGDNFQIRDGQKVIASYGENTTIGDLNGGNITVSKNGIELSDGTYKAASIKAISEEEEVKTSVFAFNGQDAENSLLSGRRWSATYYLDYVPSKIQSVIASGPSSDIFFPNSPGGLLYGYMQEGNSITVAIDGSYGDAEIWNWSAYDTLTVVYTKAARTTGVITGEEVYANNVFVRNPNKTYMSILDFIYPVGSIYMSVNEANPGDLIGGTWERIKDQFLLSAGDTYAAGNTGGSADSVVVSHTHAQTAHSHGFEGGDKVWTTASGSAEPGNQISGTAKYYAATAKKDYSWRTRTTGETAKIQATGVDGTGKNMPPYLAVYVWKRIS